MPFPRLRKWLRRVFLFLLLLFIGVAVFVFFIEEICEFAPPAATTGTSLLGKLQEHDKYQTLGASWHKEEMEISLLTIKGDPYLRGWAAARLTRSEFARLEHEMWQAVEPFRSNHPYQFWLARKGVYLFFYDQPRYFPSFVQEEVYGYACGMDNNYPEVSSPYFRTLHYQALYDSLPHVFSSLRGVQNCTSFAAWGNATSSGHLMLGHNFEWGIADIWEKHRLLSIVHPHEGIPFVSVSWPGMSGVVSGVNRERLAVLLHGVPSGHEQWKGTPVTVLARRILQEAKNLETAFAILREAHTSLSQSFLLADGKSGKVAVVEKSPERTALRGVEPPACVITCVNHFQSAEFKGVHDEDGSARRLARLKELMSRHSGKIDANIAAAILRDNKMAGDVSAGMGHLHTINSSHVSHSLILDLSEGKLWLARGPRLCGQYLPLSLTSLFQEGPEATFVHTAGIIPVDSQFGAKQLKQLTTWQENILQWQQKPEEVSKIIGVLQSLNNDHFLTMVATGDFYFHQNKHARAREWWLKGFNHYPYGDWPAIIKKRLSDLPK
jgi:hypothetical protein